MKKLLLILLVVGVIHTVFFRVGSVTLGAGVMAPDEPLQEALPAPVGFSFNDNYTVTPLASFRIRAKVLSREDYRFGSAADLAPMDLALGWGRMSDESVLVDVEISQSNRFYYWGVETLVPPIPFDEIKTHSANMHLIPKDSGVHSMMKQVRKGDIVEFSGSLVRVNGRDGMRWTSSLTRSDSGSGGCELVFVEDFRVVPVDELNRT
jgi:hypothetical protein